MTDSKDSISYARCPDELQFRVENDETTKEFTAIVKLLWHDEGWAVDILLSGFSTRKEAEDVGCKKLFDRAKFVHESNGVPWRLGDDFRPQGSRAQ